MVDFANETHLQLHKKNLPDFEAKRTTVLAALKSLQIKVSPILDILKAPEWKNGNGNLEALKEKFHLDKTQIDTLYEYAMFQYDVGNYAVCADALYHFGLLSNDLKKKSTALWGKLSCCILSHNWDAAHDDIFAIRDSLESLSGNVSLNTKTLHERAWLLHWSLFVFFNHPNGKESLIDLFMSSHYLNAVQTICPWLLRPLAVALIISKKRKAQLKEFASYIQAESSTDPVLQFVIQLSVHYNFDAALRILNSVDLSTDFYLNTLHDEFVHCARQGLFEVYCRIHQTIDLPSLAKKLGVETSVADQWIAHLIKESKMDAKIESNTVKMGLSFQTISEQLLEKCQALALKSTLLSCNIEKRQLELDSRVKQ